MKKHERVTEEKDNHENTKERKHERVFGALQFVTEKETKTIYHEITKKEKARKFFFLSL